MTVRLSGIEKKLQQKIVFVFQRLPKEGVYSKILHLFYDGVSFDQETRIREQFELHAQHVSSPEEDV